MVKNTPLKDKKWKEKVQRKVRGIQPCFLHDGAHGLFWNATKAVKFLLNFQVHFALYGQDDYVFEREFMNFLMFHDDDDDDDTFIKVSKL